MQTHRHAHTCAYTHTHAHTHTRTHTHAHTLTQHTPHTHTHTRTHMHTHNTHTHTHAHTQHTHTHTRTHNTHTHTHARTHMHTHNTHTHTHTHHTNCADVALLSADLTCCSGWMTCPNCSKCPTRLRRFVTHKLLPSPSSPPHSPAANVLLFSSLCFLIINPVSFDQCLFFIQTNPLMRFCFPIIFSRLAACFGFVSTNTFLKLRPLLFCKLACSGCHRGSLLRHRQGMKLFCNWCRPSS